MKKALLVAAVFVTGGDRYDGCHFSSEGMERAAGLWWEAIRPRPGK